MTSKFAVMHDIIIIELFGRASVWLPGQARMARVHMTLPPHCWLVPTVSRPRRDEETKRRQTHAVSHPCGSELSGGRPRDKGRIRTQMRKKGKRRQNGDGRSTDQLRVSGDTVLSLLRCFHHVRQEAFSRRRPLEISNLWRVMLRQERQTSSSAHW